MSFSLKKRQQGKEQMTLEWYHLVWLLTVFCSQKLCWGKMNKSTRSSAFSLVPSNLQRSKPKVWVGIQGEKKNRKVFQITSPSLPPWRPWKMLETRFSTCRDIVLSWERVAAEGRGWAIAWELDASLAGWSGPSYIWQTLQALSEFTSPGLRLQPQLGSISTLFRPPDDRKLS